VNKCIECSVNALRLQYACSVIECTVSLVKLGGVMMISLVYNVSTSTTSVTL
jgi:hypothetical protein